MSKSYAIADVSVNLPSGDMLVVGLSILVTTSRLSFPSASKYSSADEKNKSSTFCAVPLKLFFRNRITGFSNPLVSTCTK